MKKNVLVKLVLAVGLLLCAVSGAWAQAESPETALKAVFAQQSLLPVSSGPGVTPACGLFCDTTFHGLTTTISGSGSDCTTAQSSLSSQLSNIAKADCQNYSGFGHCNFVVHVTVACTLIAPGTYQVQGYATYNCRDTTC